MRVRGHALAVVMRTPGRERELLAGFLASEGVIGQGDDLLAVEACFDPETGEPAPNVWNAALAEGVSFDPERSRFAVVGSSCGLCGTRTLEELEKDLPSLAPAPAQVEALLESGFGRLRQVQPLFEATGAVHGAALLTEQGELLDFAEDVGRHNAVDKILGARLLADDYPLVNPVALLVTGRISFEIVQKAALAGVPVLAGIGAPTGLAVELATRSGQTLFGMVRNGCANRYGA